MYLYRNIISINRNHYKKGSIAEEAMRLGKLGEQVVLKSEKAFEKINFLDYEAVAVVKYYTKKVTRDRDAQREYRKSKRTQATIQELYILDIMRENIKHGDPRLQ